MFQASVEQIWAMKAVKYAETHMKVSVILRPSPIQFYIAYSTYEKAQGEGLVHFITWMASMLT